MFTIEKIIHAANEAITDCGSEVEMLQKVEKIKASLQSGGESYKQLGNIKLRLNRILTSQIKGTEPIEYYDIQINKVQNSIIESISNLKYQEVCVPFEYDNRKGIIYLICDSQGDLIYKFSGTLLDGKPEGEGIAKYVNGDYFEGKFKHGMREGSGKLFDRNNRLIKDGIWKNDKFIKKYAIDYFPDDSVAASYLKEGEDLRAFDSELMIIPGLHHSGLLAFPITGDSMFPAFSDSDIIVCHEVTSFSDVKNNKPYVLFHENVLLLKIIQIISRPNDKIVLRLISENHIKYQPFDIIPNENTKIYKLVLQIIKH